MSYKSKRSKATDIPISVKKIVWERDKHQCIVCGSSNAFPNAHYIARSHSGLGIEENVVTLCLRCHNAYDNGNDTEFKNYIQGRIESHLKSIYPNWNKDDLIYRKWTQKKD